MNIEDIVLSEDQQKAMDAICDFVADPEQAVFVLSGYAGTGKSTLVSHILDFLPKYMKTLAKFDKDYTPMESVLTATTNKACEALAQISGNEVITIHSLLKIRVAFTARGDSYLDPNKAKHVYNKLIWIDEASFLDREMLGYIFEYTDEHCKIIFMGDPAQLAPVKSADTPVFKLEYPGAKLEKIMRQAAGNPIIELATLFRLAVSGEWPDAVDHLIDGTHIRHLDRDSFNEAVLEEFTRPDWRFTDSKILAWTNARGVQYNNYVREHAKGDPELQVMDYAIVNAFCSMDKVSFKTDQMVQITAIEDGSDFDTPGKWYELNHQAKFFMPDSMAHRKAALKEAIDQDNGRMLFAVKQQWVDLRAVYACTVNKSQGSTYDKVYVDLDDIGSCRNKNTLARMLYVSFSRARYQLVLTGDLR